MIIVIIIIIIYANYNYYCVPLFINHFCVRLTDYISRFVNHAFYWAVMSPNKAQEPRIPTGKIAKLIEATYGNFSSFKKWFDDEASSLFGSGYTWLCQDVTSGVTRC